MGRSRTRRIAPGLLLLAGYVSAPAQSRLHVRADAPPNGDGLSWATAFGDIQDALDLVAALGSVEEVWVAAAVYRPDRGTLNRSARFALCGGLAVYGGFAGYETQLEQRDPAANVTVLSGDLLGNDTPGFGARGDNSYHVVAADAVYDAVLDGFVIRGGNAMSLGGDDAVGGGATIRDARVRLAGCRFESNRASFGGAMYALRSTVVVVEGAFHGNAGSYTAGAIFAYDGCDVRLRNTTFAANTAVLQGGAIASAHDGALTAHNCAFYGNSVMAYGGGAILSNTGTMTVANCVFSGNSAGGNAYGGGAIRNERGDCYVHNCTLYGNAAGAAGGGIAHFLDGNVVIANSILWANVDAGGTSETAQLDASPSQTTLYDCCVQGWTGSLPGTGNFGHDPAFIDPEGPDGVPGTPDDVLIPDGCRSPCVDTGADDLLPPDLLDLDGDGDLMEPLPLDAAGLPRIAGANVDRGAFEFPAPTCVRGDMDCDGDVDFDDIDAFVVALGGPEAYGAGHPDCFWLNADCDYNGRVDFDDIDVFVVLLGG